MTLFKRRSHSIGRQPRPASLHREIELDFVRGIAILMVMDFHGPRSILTPVYHLFGYENLGWSGVDLFFVLSGFLIGGLLMKEWRVRHGIDCRRFLIRRGLKIWPQYYLFLIVYVITHHRTLRQSWGDILNIQNYVTGSIPLTWSLAIEEHTYLILTGILFIASRHKWTAKRLFTLLSCICLFEIVFRYILLECKQSIFLPTHARLDSILYGVLLAMIYHFRPEIFARLRSAVWLWAVAGIGAVLLLRPQHVRPLFLATQHDAVTLMAISIIMLLYRPLPEGRRHSAPYRLVAWIGLYSYGIYLWHMSVINLVQLHLHHLPGALEQTVIAIGQIGLGFAMSNAVEFPALKLRDRLFPRRVDSPVGEPAELVDGST